MSAYRQSLQIALAGVQGPLPASLASLAEEWGSPESPVQALYQAAKRKEVRRLALHLLAGLPISSFAQRMMARAIEWLAYTPGELLRAAKLEVRLPAAYDKAWSFDGIPEKTTRQHEKIGDKANWLVEVLSQVPLESLLQQLAIPPANWAKLVAEHEYAAALWTGSMGSFERYPSSAMLGCLHSVPMAALKAKLVAVSLREAAESKDPDSWLSPLMTDDFDPLSTVAQLPRLDLAWSQRLFTRLKSQTAAQKGQPIYWGDLLSRFAERIHPTLLPDYLAFLDPLGNEPYIGKAVNAAVEIADLRHKLHQHRP